MNVAGQNMVSERTVSSLWHRKRESIEEGVL